MPRSRTFALLLAIALAVLCIALPATSLAQSAGDDQYQDPLAGQNNGGGHSGSSGNSGSSGSAGTAPATPTPAAATDPATPAATTAQSGTGQLPRTGFDVVITVEVGLAMLLMGIIAQRMVVLRDRRDQF